MDQVAVVYNPHAGTLRAGSSSEERVAALLSERGVSPHLHAFAPGTVAEDVRGLLAAGPDALIVAGGDGTVRTVAACLTGSDVPLGILPTGTMNVLARDLGLPTGLEAAVEAVLRAQPQKIDVATVNGELFLCSSTLAMMPHLGRLRERARGGFGWQTMSLLGRGVRILWRYPRMRLTIVVNGTDHEVRTRAVVVTCNPLSAGPSAGLGRPRLDGGVLAVYVAQDRTNWDLLAVAAKLLDGSWQRDKRLHAYQGQTVQVRSPALTMTSVMSDGEIGQLDLPLTYEIQPRALTILKPRATP